MAKRVCSEPGCGQLVDRGLCSTHRAEARRRRGTTTQQGYGWAHQKRRARLVPQAIGTRCPRCGNPMTDPTEMDAAHTTPVALDPTSVADHVLCATCNRSDGGRLGQALRST